MLNIACFLNILNLEVLSDDYCHKKLETVKVKGSTAKNSVITEFFNKYSNNAYYFRHSI